MKKQTIILSDKEQFAFEMHFSSNGEEEKGKFSLLYNLKFKYAWSFVENLKIEY